MRTVVCAAILLFAGSVNAQQWQWAHRAISTAGNGLASVNMDSSGHPYFMGFALSDPTIDGGNGTFTYPGMSTFIVRYSPSGDVLWTGGGWGGNPEPRSMSIDKHSNCFITGDFSGTMYMGIGTDTLKRTADPNGIAYFLTKLDKDGKAKFFIRDGGNCYNSGQSVTAFSTDELIVSWNDETFCDHNGIDSAIFIKTDNNGNTLWSLPPPHSTFGPHNITPTRDQGFLLADEWLSTSLTFQGMSGSQTLSVPANPNYSDVFLAKYTLAGNVQWAKAVRGSNYQHYRDVATDPSNNIIFAVSGLDSTSYDNIPLLPAGPNRTEFIIKTDAGGNLLRYLAITDPKYWTYDLQTDRSGNIYLLCRTGSSLVIGGDTVHFTVPSNGFTTAVIKLDPNMDYLWSQYITYTGCNCGASGLVVTDSLIYLGMNFDGNIALHGSSYQFSHSSNNVWFDCLFAAIRNGNTPTGMSDPGKDDEVSISPNPSSGTFTVQTGKRGKCAIAVYDVLGKQVWHMDEAGGMTTIDLGASPKGVYFVVLGTGSSRVIKKIILE
jgi:hypothetical protein